MDCRPTRPRPDSTRCARRWPSGSRARYALPRLDAAREVLPVNGTREALFAFAQVVVDGTTPAPVVVCPNPFYQIYEGAALLAGAQPLFLNQTAENELRPRSGIADRGRVAAHAAPVRLLARQSDRARARPRRLARRCSTTPTATGSSSPRTSAIRRSILTRHSRRSAASRPRTASDATSGISSSSPVCRSARTRPDSARAASPATRRCWRASSCIARIMEAR